MNGSLNVLIDQYLVCDVPFALMYSFNLGVDLGNATTGKSEEQDDGAKLEGWLGVPLGPGGRPRAHKMLMANSRFQSAFRRARDTRQPIPFNLEGHPELTQGLMEEPAVRGFGDPPHEAVLCPIEPTTYENVSGILVVGVNPRRPYDDAYQSFVRTLGRAISSSLASVLLFGEQERLAQVASERTLQAVEMAERAGMCY